MLQLNIRVDIWEEQCLYGGPCPTRAILLFYGPRLTPLNAASPYEPLHSHNTIFCLGNCLRSYRIQALPKKLYYQAFYQHIDVVTAGKPLSPMLSRLETLPQEIFDDIVARLGIPAALALLYCNKRLKKAVEPAIYRRQNVKDIAMYSACKSDNDATIRLVVGRYGASANTIEKLTYPESDGSDVELNSADEDDAWPVISRMSTLYLALRYPDDGNSRVCAARALLDLGARVEPAGVSATQVRGLLRRLLSRWAWKKLPIFLEAGFDAWITKVSAVDRMLIAAAKDSGGQGTPAPPPPPKVVHYLLDRGADPNLLHFVKYNNDYECPYGIMTPLSAAISARSPSMARLLLERGADIRGPPITKESKTWDWVAHIPIFAAVQVMAEQDSRDMVELCLEYGADINQCAVVGYNGGYCNVTPVLIYLYYVMDLFEGKADDALMPADGLAFLLEKGASLNIPHQMPNIGITTAQYRYPPRALDILIYSKLQLQQYGRYNQMGFGWRGNKDLSSLTTREFFRTACLLVRHGDADTSPYICFLLNEGITNHAKAFEKGEGYKIWCEFVSLLLDNYIPHNSNHDPNNHLGRRRQGSAAGVDMDIDIGLDAEPGTTASGIYHSDKNIDNFIVEGLNQILGYAVRATGLSLTEIQEDGNKDGVGFVVIHQLLEKPGVDINAPFFGRDRTILHELCAAYLKEEEHRHLNAGSLQEDIPRNMRNECKRYFLRFLIRQGADPRLAIAGVAEGEGEGEGDEVGVECQDMEMDEVDEGREERQVKAKVKARAKTALEALREPGVAELMEAMGTGEKGADFLPETSREYLESLAAVLEGDWEASERHWEKAMEEDNRALFSNK